MVIRLKVTLRPRKNSPVNLNYQYYLAALCNNMLSDCREDLDEKLKSFNAKNNRKAELLTFTQFFCQQYEIRGNKIIFKDTISWYISSPVYELILQLVQEIYRAGSILVAEEELELLGIEASETADVSLVELNRENFTIGSKHKKEAFERIANYFEILEEEKINLA